jgi:hypothetical protein
MSEALRSLAAGLKLLAMESLMFLYGCSSLCGTAMVKGLFSTTLGFSLYDP